MTPNRLQTSIRRARRGDVPAIAEMAAEFHRFLAAIDGSDPGFDVAQTAEKLAVAGFGAQPLYMAHVAESQAGMAAYAISHIGFWADGFEGAVFISDLFVREGWRGRGIGRQLMEAMSAAGRQKGCTRLMWTVWNRNCAARAFYTRLGGRIIDEEVLMSLPT